MNSIDEQQQLNQASIDFLNSGKQLAEAIAKEIRRIDEEKRMRLEDDYQNRMLKPEATADE